MSKPEGERMPGHGGERRRHERCVVDGGERPVEVVTYAGTPGVRCTGVRDIGLGGMRLTLSGPERPGARVTLSVALGGEDEQVEVVAQVVWARRAAPHEVGIRFLEVDASRLASHLR